MNPSVILTIDSTGQNCRVGLLIQANPHAYPALAALETCPNPRQQAETLIPLAQQVLAQTGLTTPTCIAVATGPGSFTGIRIGLAAAQGLARGWGCPCIGINRFDMIGQTPVLVGAPHPVAIILDSLRTELFAQLWYQGNALGAPIMAAPEALLTTLRTNARNNRPTDDILITGDGALHIPDAPPALMPVPANDDLVILAHLAIKALACNKTAPALPSAFYIRPPDVTLRAKG